LLYIQLTFIGQIGMKGQLVSIEESNKYHA
jgi:hypothetical protein